MPRRGCECPGGGTMGVFGGEYDESTGTPGDRGGVQAVGRGRVGGGVLGCPGRELGGDGRARGSPTRTIPLPAAPPTHTHPFAFRVMVACYKLWPLRPPAANSFSTILQQLVAGYDYLWRTAAARYSQDMCSKLQQHLAELYIIPFLLFGRA